MPEAVNRAGPKKQISTHYKGRPRRRDAVRHVARSSSEAGCGDACPSNVAQFTFESLERPSNVGLLPPTGGFADVYGSGMSKAGDDVPSTGEGAGISLKAAASLERISDSFSGLAGQFEALSLLENNGFLRSGRGA